MSTVGPIFETVLNFFQEQGWSFSQIDDEPLLTLNFQGDHAVWTCIVQAKEENGQCLFYSVYPEKIAEERRPEVAEFITRANYGLPSGNFEMDLSDGELRFKTSIDVTGDRLSVELFSNLGSANVTNFDRYLPGVEMVLQEGKTPAQAIAEIED